LAIRSAPALGPIGSPPLGDGTVPGQQNKSEIDFDLIRLCIKSTEDRTRKMAPSRPVSDLFLKLKD
jgi:hypothetical protein